MVELHSTDRNVQLRKGTSRLGSGSNPTNFQKRRQNLSCTAAKLYEIILEKNQVGI